MKRALALASSIGLMFLAMLIGGCRGEAVARSTSNFPMGTGFTSHQIAVDGESRTVWVFVPRNYRPERKYPTVLFLHGLFEAGNGGTSCLSGGLAPVIAKEPDKWPFITIFPQSDGTWRGDARDRFAIASLDWARTRWSIDPDRVILAGLSFGGLGTWEIGGRHPDRFAALVPVSGPGAVEWVERLILLPTWAFDFRNDPFVNSEASEQMCKEIRARGGSAKLTEFVGVGHDCWDRAVYESDLVDWMLKQRRRHPIPIAAPLSSDQPRKTAMADLPRD